MKAFDQTPGELIPATICGGRRDGDAIEVDALTCFEVANQATGERWIRRTEQAGRTITTRFILPSRPRIFPARR